MCSSRGVLRSHTCGNMSMELRTLIECKRGGFMRGHTRGNLVTRVEIGWCMWNSFQMIILVNIPSTPARAIFQNNI